MPLTNHSRMNNQTSDQTVPAILHIIIGLNIVTNSSTLHWKESCNRLVRINKSRHVSNHKLISPLNINFTKYKYHNVQNSVCCQ